MQSQEIWEVFPLNESYEVSNYGNVRSVDRLIEYSDGRIRKWKGKILKKQMWVNGYQQITMSTNSALKQYSVHRLVAITHIPNPQNLREVNHKNGIKTDNRVDNLEWCTPSQNSRHAFSIGLCTSARYWLGKKGYSHNKSKEVIEYDENWKEIRRFGSGRECMDEIGNNNIWYYITKKKSIRGRYYSYK